MTDKKRLITKILASVGLLAVLVLLGCLMLGGGNFELLKSAIKNEYTTEELRDLLRGFGWRGYITIVVLTMLQIMGLIRSVPGKRYRLSIASAN
jgi:hypothetical protein